MLNSVKLLLFWGKSSAAPPTPAIDGYFGRRYFGAAFFGPRYFGAP